MTQQEILKNYPHFNLARIDALLMRLDRLGIEPDKYNVRSRYEEPHNRDKPLCEQKSPAAKLTR